MGLLVITLWYTVVSFAVRELQPTILPEPEYHESACFGTAYDYVSFQFNCTRNDSAIAVSSVKAATKPSTQQCSTVKSSGIDPIYYSRCCTVDQERDCIVTFHNNEESLMYEIQSVCNGHQKCPSPVRVQRMPVNVKCKKRVFPEESNYMVVDYFCIKKSKIAVLKSTIKRSEGHQSVYLQSAGYPCNSTYSNVEEWCKISVSDATIPIQVVSIDVQLAETEWIVFKEAKSCKQSDYNITEQSNNKYQIVNIFNMTDAVFLSYKSGAFSSGRFWIGFVSDQTLSISCGITIDENCTTRPLLNNSTFNIENNKVCSATGVITSDKFQTTDPTKKSTSTTYTSHSTGSSTKGTTSSDSTTITSKNHSPGSSINGTKTTSSDSAKTTNQYHSMISSINGTTTSSDSTSSTNKNHSPGSFINSTTITSSDSTTITNKNHSPGSSINITTIPSSDSTTITNKNHSPGSSINGTKTTSSDSTKTTKKYHNLGSSIVSTTKTSPNSILTYKSHSPGSSTDNTSTTSENSISETNEYNGPGSSTDSTTTTNTSTGKNYLWWIAVIGVIMVFIVILGIVYRYNKRKRQISDMNTQQETSLEDPFFVTPDEKNLIPPCKTTIDIFIPEKRNNVLPKINECEIKEKEGVSEKKGKKKKRKRKKKSKHRGENDVPDDNISDKDNF